MNSKEKWTSLEKKMQTMLQCAVDDLYVAGANLLVLKDGQEVAYCEAGYADIEKRITISRNTIFRMFSMTKPITGAAAMLLMERGLIDLADPVHQYLPGFKKQQVATENGMVPVIRDMTIKHLLSMTAGLSYPNPATQAGREAAEVFEQLDQRLFSENPMTTQELANALGSCSLGFHPGESWMYSTCADVLGAVIEVVTGMRYGEFLNKEFFEPLGMKDTSFYVPENKQNRLAKLYIKESEAFVEFHTNHLGNQYKGQKPPAYEAGGAGLTSTIDDYAKFTTMLINRGEYDGRRILSPNTVDFFTTGELLPHQQKDMWKGWESLAGYSYSNFLRILKHPNLAYLNGRKGEYGWDGWLGTYFSNLPEDNVSFLLMMQKKDAGTTSLARKLRNVVMAELL